MQNLDKHNEDAMWSKKLLDTENELFVPLYAWDNMEKLLDNTFGKQEKIEMEKLFPLPNHAAGDMEAKLDIHYAQAFDNNLSEKLTTDNISLPPNAWASMETLLNQEFGNEEIDENNELLDLPNNFALPPNAWALMEEALNLEFESSHLDNANEQLQLSDNFALPPNAWALMEEALNLEFETENLDILEDIREPQWHADEHFELPNNAWSLMESKLNAYPEENSNNTKKIIKYGLLAFLLGSILAGSYYYFIQKNTSKLSTTDNQSTLAQALHNNIKATNTIEEKTIVAEQHSTLETKEENNTKDSNIFAKNSAFNLNNKKQNSLSQNSSFERISNSLVQKNSLYEYSSTNSKLTSFIDKSNSINTATKANDSQHINNNNENIFEKGNSVLDLLNNNNNTDYQQQLLENNEANNILLEQAIAENLNIENQENTLVNNINSSSDINTENLANNNANNNTVLTNDKEDNILAIQEALLLAEIETSTEQIDSFSLQQANTNHENNTTKRWNFFAHAGLSSKLIDINKKLSVAMNIGGGVAYDIGNNNKIAVGLQVKQIHPNGGFFGKQPKIQQGTALSYPQGELVDYASRNISSVDIYRLNSITMLEMPISFQKKLAKKHKLELGVKVAMNLFTNIKRNKYIGRNTEHAPMHINRYDIGLALLNFGVFASYEYQINSRFSFIVQYSQHMSNMLQSAQDRTRIYANYDRFTPENGNVYLSMTGMSKDNNSVLVETPERLINNDLLLAIRYHF